MHMYFPSGYVPPEQYAKAPAPLAQTCTACDGKGQEWRLMCLECHGEGKIPKPEGGKK